MFVQTEHNIWVDTDQPQLLYQLGTKVVQSSVYGGS